MGTLRLTVVVAVVLAAVIGFGRWERSGEIGTENRGIERVRALVGPLDQPALSGYRVQPNFDCLVYRRATNPFALELCADHTGRVVEAIDRRSTRRHIYSLRPDPGSATVRIDRRELDRLIARMVSGR